MHGSVVKGGLKCANIIKVTSETILNHHLLSRNRGAKGSRFVWSSCREHSQGELYDNTALDSDSPKTAGDVLRAKNPIRLNPYRSFMKTLLNRPPFAFHK